MGRKSVGMRSSQPIAVDAPIVVIHDPPMVAAGHGPGAGIAMSLNVTDWILADDPSDDFWSYAVAYDPVSGTWVVGADDQVIYSTDLTTWSVVTLPWGTGTSMFDVVWCDSLGLFIGAGFYNGHADDLIATSPDGITWTKRSTPWGVGGAGSVQGFAWSHTLGKVLAFGTNVNTADSSNLTMMESTDGISWSNIAGSNLGGTLLRGCYSPELDLWIAVGQSGDDSVIYSSPDAATWTSRSTVGFFGDVVWSPELGLFVACATGNSSVRTSPDGITWTNRSYSIGGTNEGQGICWSPTLGLFILCGDSRVYTSPDSIAWTYHNFDFTFSPKRPFVSA